MAIWTGSEKDEARKTSNQLVSIKLPTGLILDYNQIKSVEFDIEVLECTEQALPDFSKMVIHHIELGNAIEFKNKGHANFTGTCLPLDRILVLRTKVQTKGGFFGKKEDIVLEIVFSSLNAPKEEKVYFSTSMTNKPNI